MRVTQETEVLELRPIVDKLVFRVSPPPHTHTCLVLSSWVPCWSQTLLVAWLQNLALSWTEQDWQASWVEESSSPAETLQLRCLLHFLWICFFVS